MKKQYMIFLAAVSLLLGILACNFPGAQGPNIAPEVTEPFDAFIPSEPAGVSTEPQVQATATTAPPPSSTPTITETPTVTPTFTPEIPMAWVTKNTNCRTGPGTEYDIVHIFLVGEKAEIVARSSVSNYVIVEAPDGSGRTCWLWMQYGQQSGSTDDLPQRTPPPTPTPEASFSFNFDSREFCGPNEVVHLQVNNTGATNFESFQLSITDTDTSTTLSNDGNSFGQSPTCLTTSVDPLEPGASVYIGTGFVPPIAGHTITAELELCTEDGYAGICLTKSITFDVPSFSDANVKEHFEPIDNHEILQQISDLPITRWSYKDPARQGRHIGPMAQDFNERFGVGEYEDYISAVDSSGVALAAIQALSGIAEEQERRIAVLEEQNQSVLAQNEALEARLTSLESQRFHGSMMVWAVVLFALVFAGNCFARRRSEGSRT